MRSFMSTLGLVALVALSSITVVACSGSDEKGTSDNGALRNNDGSTSKGSTSKDTPTKTGDGAQTGLEGTKTGGATATANATLGAFVPKEVVVISDVQVADDGTERPRARIIASSETGLCDRLNLAFDLKAGEKAVSIWLDGASFAVGKSSVQADATNKTSGASFLDSSAMCKAEEVSEPDRGNGTFEITAVDSVVKGSIDVTFNRAGHVVGTFEAKTCAKQTRGYMNCPPEAGN